jgi:hypothetical protein
MSKIFDQRAIKACPKKKRCGSTLFTMRIRIQFLSHSGSGSRELNKCGSFGSLTFWCGSVSVDPGGLKKRGSYVPVSRFGTLVHLHYSSEIKSSKEVTKQKKSNLFLLLLLYLRKIGNRPKDLPTRYRSLFERQETRLIYKI